ncbi:MAG: hypothetical protein ACJ75L_10560 [Gaiellaceae bacterium]
MNSGQQERLDYPFDPRPSWIQTDLEAGRLSPERRDILDALVNRADTRKLRRGQPTPEMRVASLAAATHRGTDRAKLEALRRLLREMRQEGHLDYTTRGTADRVVYVFSIARESPSRSGVVPPSEAAPVPSSDDSRDPSTSGIAAADAAGRSEVEPDPATATVPGRPSSVPPSDTPANPFPEPDPAGPRSAPVPGSLDEREDPTTAWTEREAPRGIAREDDPNEEALFDRLWEESGESHGRGAYWEPDS